MSYSLSLKKPLETYPDLDDPDLVCAYFNRKSSGRFDSSLNGYDLTEGNNPKYHNPNILELPASSDYLLLSGAGDVITSYPISVSYWVRQDTITPSSGNGSYCFLNRFNVTASAHNFNMADDQLRLSNNNNGAGDFIFGAAGDVKPGTWIHLVAVWKSNIGADITAYLDGSLYLTHNQDGSTIDNIDRIGINRLDRSVGSASGDQPFFMKDFRCYNRTLDESEIAAIHREGKPEEDDLVGLWLPRGGKNYLEDYSGNDQDMSLVGDVATNDFNSAGPFSTTNYLERVVTDWQSGDTEGAVCAWVYFPSDDANTKAIFAVTDPSVGNRSFMLRFDSSERLEIYSRATGGISRGYTATGQLTFGKWIFVGATSNGSNWELNINGVNTSLETVVGTDGSWINNVGTTTQIMVGVNETSTSGVEYPWGNGGELSDIRYYNTYKNPSWFTNYYNRTRRFYNV
jgi:hypothetical protein